ncbi:ABC transporter permease [Kitasatospora herbaricolor]|uniref:Transport permease protein n=1 Tax=Kitasatospora herbaricolor TaxID=68217 RepID=A0ABZ1WBA5_9ACTN|nr:ABC transporter permease [Kitasatospora herbaricolor]
MFKHTLMFLGYELGKSARNPVWPLFGILQPVLYLLLFAPLLANTTVGESRAHTLLQFTPGVMVMVALFGSLFVGFGMIAEIRSGVLERLAASAASRPAIVLGRVLRDVLILVVQALLVVLVAMAMGMRPSPGGLVLMLLLMAVTGVFASGVSYGLALAVRQETAMSQILQFFSLPLILLTGILLPMSLAPHWMQVVAKANPLFYAVQAGRALFSGNLSDSSVPVAFGLIAVLAVLTMSWSVRSIGKIAG